MLLSQSFYITNENCNLVYVFKQNFVLKKKRKILQECGEIVTIKIIYPPLPSPPLPQPRSWRREEWSAVSHEEVEV